MHKDCLLCHGEGKAQPFPANHAAFGVEICTGCHKPAQASNAFGAATAVPTETAEARATAAPAAAATPTATTAAAVSDAPKAIPHDLAGRENCLLCHSPDSGAKPAPKDHAGRTNDQCQACHKPKS
jgi:hypothetical protein